ncbi:MAG TPA: flagellar basal body P-ring protein FlgI [Phycisphaerae bacterium]|jgi:hypothetical protein
MKTRKLRVLALAASIVTAAVIAACDSSDKNRKAPFVEDTQTRVSNMIHPALRGTVGEFCALVDSAPIRVEGYGVVAGLPNTGSAYMDSRIHDLLLNRFLTEGIGLYSTGTENVDPEAILSSKKSAAVEIRGMIPPLAHKGATFDLYINALPGSDAVSLSNGLLYTSDLKQIGLTLDGNDTRTLAMGRGPVFIPAPLEAAVDIASGQKPPETRNALRNGRVIAGGVCMEDRDARLQLYAADWMHSRMIERTINAHFQSHEKAATAENDLVVSLHIPAEFKDNPSDFVDQVRHLYLESSEPGFVEHKARELIDALKEPDAPVRSLGLALQGLGYSIQPDFLKPNYTSSNKQLQYWSARAGACMQDVDGMTTLEEIVQDPLNPFRRQALLGMVEASRGRDTERATVSLFNLIRSYNTDDRVLAYHALLSMRSRAVTSYSVGKKFMMDIVPADSPPLIYILESESPRIAFIGRPITLAQGATYLSKDKLLTVISDIPSEKADAGDKPMITAASIAASGPAPGAKPATQPKEPETVTLSWISPTHDRPMVTLRTVATVPALVARATWIPEAPSDPSNEKNLPPYIGASYQRIGEMLAEMCADKSIQATIVIQRAPDMPTNPKDLALSGRPEGITETPPIPPMPTPGANTPEAGAPNLPNAVH